MSLDLKDFSVLLAKLAISKNHTLDEFVIQTYYEDLRELPFIVEILTNARKITYYSDYSRTISKFPSVSDLIKDHDVYLSKQISTKRSQLLIDNGKKRVDSKNGFSKFVFAVDCINLLGIKPDKIYAWFENIDVPESYLKERKKKGCLKLRLEEILRINGFQ
jgi:hypothetical protein